MFYIREQFLNSDYKGIPDWPKNIFGSYKEYCLSHSQTNQKRINPPDITFDFYTI